MVFEVLNGLAPQCISSCLSFYVYSHTLRSSAACLLNVPQITTKEMGNAALLHLPAGYGASLHQRHSLTGNFRRHLKTYLVRIHVLLLCFYPCSVTSLRVVLIHL